jgi:Leucine-rich repeat (LRR) protein
MDYQREIIDFVGSVGCDGRVAELLEMSVHRVLLSAGRGGSLSLPDVNDARHVADWLRAAVARDEAWLKNLDALGRPKKLMKFSRFEDILKEADKAMRSSIARDGVASNQDGQSLFEELENGFRIVRLLSSQALKRESSRMGHCVGNGGYDYVLTSQDEMILSLRDKHDKPHATLHVSPTMILQLRGKQNKRPLPKYMRLMVPLTKRLRPTDIEFGALGFLVDTQGVRHDLGNLPEGVDVDGGLVLNGTTIATLPAGMTVRGHLDLTGSSLKRLPSGLTVFGNLVFGDDQLGVVDIDELPSDLVVRRKLDIHRSRIRSLPQGIRVGSIDARQSRLRELPDGLHIDGWADFSYTKLTKLPRMMSVADTLDVGHTKITEIPADLSCRGIVFRDTDIAEIPAGVVRGGPVDCSGTKVRSLPSNLKVVGHLCIERTAISSLPDDVSEINYLFASGSRLIELPEGLGKLDSLDISRTAIERLPSQLRVTGNFFARDSKISALPDGMTVFHLDLAGCSLTLPENLVCGSLDISRSTITSLPNNLVVKETLNAQVSALSNIGANVKIGGNFLAYGSALQHLPFDLELGENHPTRNLVLDISKTAVVTLPEWPNAVFGRVNISETSINTIPSGWTIGSLDARWSSLETIVGVVETVHHSRSAGIRTIGRVKSNVYAPGVIGKLSRMISVASKSIATMLVSVSEIGFRIVTDYIKCRGTFLRSRA